MKNAFIITFVTLAMALSETVFAESHRFVDFAKVKNVTPIYKTYEHRIPEERCWMESVRHETQAHTSRTGTIVGGIIGGAIGHAVGHGKRNKKIGAAIGTVLGASIGNDVSHNRASNGRHVVYENIERCEVDYRIEVEERLSGYDVTYQYRGEIYSTFMPEHPGKRIKIHVNVSPIIE